MEIVTTLVLGIFITWASVYNLHKLSDRKINYKNIKLWIYFIVLMAVALINYFNNVVFIRITSITFSLVIFYKLLFNAKIKESIITSLVSQMVIMISEMIFIFSISIIFRLDNQDIVNHQFGSLFSNVGISLVSFCLIQIPIFKKFRNLLMKITVNLKNNQIIFFSASIIVITNILNVILYYNIDFKYSLIFTTLLTIFFLIIIIYSFNAKNNYMKISDKYNTTLNSLKEYEEILDKYRISNHENKNQLLKKLFPI